MPLYKARYSRQEILAEVGAVGQARIAAARVLIVGAGGLGCPVLQYLAGAGVGTIGIIDPDRIDISNLQRQVIYTENDAGKEKALVAKERLLQLNSGITIHAHAEALNVENALELFSGYDVIIDGTDNFAAKFLINDAAVKAGKPVVFGAIQGFDGQVCVFDARLGPCYRCLYPAPPSSPVMNCAEAGVIGALAGIIGSMQAMEALKVIIAHATFAPLAGKLLLLDARTMDIRTVGIAKNTACPVCSQEPGAISLTSCAPVCSLSPLQEIACGEAKKMENVSFIDVREPHEWEAGHIENARHLPLSALRHDASLFLPHQNGKTCIIYCQRGVRSKQAVALLLTAGYNHLYSLAGGYEAWENAKKP